MLPRYVARIEYLGPGDFVKIDCAACHHVAPLTPEALLQVGPQPGGESARSQRAAPVHAAGWEAMSSGSWGRPYQASISFFAAGSLAWLRRRHRFRLVGIALQRHDSPLEGAGFEPSVPRKTTPAFGYSLLIMKSLSAADSAPQTSPLRPASCRTLA
jgi:hypothetical protein